MRHRGNNSIEKRDWMLLRSLFTRDQQDLRGSGRLVDQIDVGTVPLSFVQIFCKGQQMLLFLTAFGMAAVHGDADQTIRFQTGKAAAHSPQGGAGFRRAAFICSGKISQVEDRCVKERFHMIRQVLMGIADQLDGAVMQFFCKACFAEPLFCRIDGFLLHVERIELCRRKLRQPDGIISVAAGGIHDDIALGYVALNEIQSKFCNVFD